MSIMAAEERMRAGPVLRASATLVPVGEDDILNPKDLDPERGIGIERSRVSEKSVWDLV